eukprot:4184456-Prymnesium_polylepis.1
MAARARGVSAGPPNSTALQLYDRTRDTPMPHRASINEPRDEGGSRGPSGPRPRNPHKQQPPNPGNPQAQDNASASRRANLLDRAPRRPLPRRKR